MQVLPRSSASQWTAGQLLSTFRSSRRGTTFICASCRSQPRRHGSNGSNGSRSHGYGLSPRKRELKAAQRAQHRSTTEAALNSVPSRPSSSYAASWIPPSEHPPSLGHARLRTRRLISISGVDAPRFLQGLVTTQIQTDDDNNNNSATTATGRNIFRQVSTQQKQTPRFYSGLLNAMGRVLHDLFIYPAPRRPGDDPHFLIEVDALQLETLRNHLRRYKLRSKVAVRELNEDEMSVWQVWNDEGTSAQEKDKQGVNTLSHTNGQSIVIPDLRAPGMGYRVLTPGSDLRAAETLSLLSEWSDSVFSAAQEEKNETSEAAYRVRRYLRGVPEGCIEVVTGAALPLEANMDVMGGIDFHKGCYVGQELTIRTRHRGVVRKRILPCVLYDIDKDSSSSPSDAASPPTSLVYDPEATPSEVLNGEDKGGEGGEWGQGNHLRGRSIGRRGKTGRSSGIFLAGIGNIGLALCRLQVMTDLVIPNDQPPAIGYKPRVEFVLRGSEEEGGGETNAKETNVGVKAFVPDWLRMRLDEDAKNLIRKE